DGMLLVVNKSGSTLSFIDGRTGGEVATVETGHAPHEVAVSPDGRWAYVTDYGTGPAPGNTVTIVDVAARARVATIQLDEHTRPHGVAVTEDGSVWVTTEGSRHVLKLDPETRTIALAAETGQEVTHMVVVASSHGRVYTANIGSGTTTAVDAGTGRVLGHLETGAGAEGLALSPDGDRVYVTNRSAGTLSEIDVATNTVVRTLAVGEFPIRVEVMPDGSRALVSNAQANELAVVDLAAWQVERRIPVGEMPVGIEIVPDGSRAYVANTQANRVSVVDLTTWRVIGEVTAGEEPDGMAWVGAAR
ncbi:MAG: YncE family protein, partial [Gemmatimonadota bacterium]